MTTKQRENITSLKTKSPRRNLLMESALPDDVGLNGGAACT